MAEKLNDIERETLLRDLRKAGWSEISGRDAITKRFTFADFSAAFAWMTRVALVAEKMDHHPEWFNVYSRIDVILTTHDCNGLSMLDIEMAKRMDELSG